MFFRREKSRGITPEDKRQCSILSYIYNRSNEPLLLRDTGCTFGIIAYYLGTTRPGDGRPRDFVPIQIPMCKGHRLEVIRQFGTCDSPPLRREILTLEILVQHKIFSGKSPCAANQQREGKKKFFHSKHSFDYFLTIWVVRCSPAVCTVTRYTPGASADMSRLSTC